MLDKIRKQTQFDTVIAFCLIFVHTLLLGYNAVWMSPTLDEPAHLVAGMSHWKYGDFSLYRVNPPLIRAIAVVPVMLSGYDVDLDMSNYQFGRPEFGLGEASSRGR